MTEWEEKIVGQTEFGGTNNNIKKTERMKTLKYILYIILPIFLLQGCEDHDKNQSFFADDELPRIFMETWSGTQPVELGGTVKWVPEVSPSDGASYEWTLDGEVITTEKDFEYTANELGEYDLKFEVTRNGVTNSRSAKLLVTKTFVPKKYNKKSIAYIDAYEGDVDNIMWDDITHIVISSALVKEEFDKDGNFIRNVDLEFKNSKLNIDNLVALAHNYGVYVLLQLAGTHDALNGAPTWGVYDFYNIATDKAKRDDVINQVLNYVTEKKIDGIDIYFDKAHDGAFASPKLVKEFYEEFAKVVPEKSEIGQDFLLTASVVVGWTRTSNIDLATIDRYDWVSILAFAQEDLTPTPHSSTWSCTDNAEFWTGAGLPAEKVIIGCPAFSLKYDLKGETPTWENLYLFTSYIPYKDLLQTYPDAYNSNSLNVADGIYYDGFSAIEEKAEIVKSEQRKYGGMALWKINFDSTDPNKSLLKKMNSALGNLNIQNTDD